MARHVRFGSFADITRFEADVRFTTQKPTKQTLQHVG
jgi:hypothetical protein